MANPILLMLACMGPKIPDPPDLPQAPPQQRMENTTAEIMIIELAILEEMSWSEIDRRFTRINRGCNPELHTYWGQTAEQYNRSDLAIDNYHQAIRCHGLKEEKKRILLQKRIKQLSSE